MARPDALRLQFVGNPRTNLRIEMALVTLNQKAATDHGDGESKQREHL